VQAFDIAPPLPYSVRSTMIGASPVSLVCQASAVVVRSASFGVAYSFAFTFIFSGS
jgi:hypothetical protein